MSIQSIGGIVLSTADNEILCRVGSGTGMGKVMRSYWLPVLASFELDEAGNPPLEFTVLGEKLVAYREADGGVAVLGALCPHRCAPLSLARNEEGGLRCIYHGWKMDRTGTLVDVPSEPEDSPLVGKRVQPAYPAVDQSGLIWVYLGPAESQPELPEFNWMSLPSEQVSIQKAIVEANWVQTLEGLLDSAHISFLHSDRVLASADSVSAVKAEVAETVLTQPSKDTRPKIEVEDTEYGFHYAALRRPEINPDIEQYARVTSFVMPMYCFIPVGPGLGQMECVVPLDDERTIYIAVAYDYNEPVDDQLIREQMGRVWDRDLRPDHTRIANKANGWLQDRVAMADGRSFSGLSGSFAEDAAVTEGMGAIVDRTHEHLGRSDRAIVHMRRRMLAAAKDESFTAVGVDPAVTLKGSNSATDGIIAAGEPWNELSYVGLGYTKADEASLS